MAATKVKKASKKKVVSKKTTKVKAKTTAKKPAKKVVKKSAKKVVSKAVKGKAKVTKAKPTSKLRKLINSVKKAVHMPSSGPKKQPPLEKVGNAYNKSQLLSTLADRTELNRRYAAAMLDELFHIMSVHLKKGGPEKFIFPGAFKVVVRKIPAKKARTGINPFTGQTTTFKAKPASRRVKIIPLKALKEMAHK